MTNSTGNWNTSPSSSTKGIKLHLADGSKTVIKILSDKPVKKFSHWIQLDGISKEQEVICPGDPQGCPLCQLLIKQRRYYGVWVLIRETGEIKILNMPEPLREAISRLRGVPEWLDYDIEVEKINAYTYKAKLLIPVALTQQEEQTYKTLQEQHPWSTVNPIKPKQELEDLVEVIDRDWARSKGYALPSHDSKSKDSSGNFSIKDLDWGLDD